MSIAAAYSWSESANGLRESFKADKDGIRSGTGRDGRCKEVSCGGTDFQRIGRADIGRRRQDSRRNVANICKFIFYYLIFGGPLKITKKGKIDLYEK